MKNINGIKLNKAEQGLVDAWGLSRHNDTLLSFPTTAFKLCGVTALAEGLTQGELNTLAKFATKLKAAIDTQEADRKAAGGRVASATAAGRYPTAKAVAKGVKVDTYDHANPAAQHWLKVANGSAPRFVRPHKAIGNWKSVAFKSADSAHGFARGYHSVQRMDNAPSGHFPREQVAVVTADAVIVYTPKGHK